MNEYIQLKVSELVHLRGIKSIKDLSRKELMSLYSAFFFENQNIIQIYEGMLLDELLSGFFDGIYKSEELMMELLERASDYFDDALNSVIEEEYKNQYGIVENPTLEELGWAKEMRDIASYDLPKRAWL